MAFRFITHAIDGLLKDEKCKVVCYTDAGFEHRSIDDVAFKTYHINSELLELGKEYGETR